MKIKKIILVIVLAFFHIISSNELLIFFKNNKFIIKNKKKEIIQRVHFDPLIIKPFIDEYFENREKLLSNKEFFKNFMPVIINKKRIEQFQFIKKVHQYYEMKFLKAYWTWEHYKKFIKKHFLKEEPLKKIDLNFMEKDFEKYIVPIYENQDLFEKNNYTLFTFEILLIEQYLQTFFFNNHLKEKQTEFYRCTKAIKEYLERQTFYKPLFKEDKNNIRSTKKLTSFYYLFFFKENNKFVFNDHETFSIFFIKYLQNILNQYSLVTPQNNLK